jgi:hypothetical protein
LQVHSHLTYFYGPPEPLRAGASRLSCNKIIESLGETSSYAVEMSLTIWPLCGSVPGYALQFKLLFVELIIDIAKAADGAL